MTCYRVLESFYSFLNFFLFICRSCVWFSGTCTLDLCINSGYNNHHPSSFTNRIASGKWKLKIIVSINQVSYDHRSYELNLSNCVYRSLKKSGLQRGSAPNVSGFIAQLVTSVAPESRGHGFTPLKSWLFQASIRNCFDHRLLDFKSAVQHMKYFIYCFN